MNFYSAMGYMNIIILFLILIAIIIIVYSVVPYIVDNYKSQNLLCALLKYMNSHKNISIIVLSIFVIICIYIKYTFYFDNTIPSWSEEKNITTKEQQQYGKYKLKQHIISEDGISDNGEIPDSDIISPRYTEMPKDLSTDKPQGAIRVYN